MTVCGEDNVVAEGEKNQYHNPCNASFQAVEPWKVYLSSLNFSRAQKYLLNYLLWLWLTLFQDPFCFFLSFFFWRQISRREKKQKFNSMITPVIMGRTEENSITHFRSHFEKETLSLLWVTCVTVTKHAWTSPPYITYGVLGGGDTLYHVPTIF